MSQTRNAIVSPCISTCRINPQTSWCEGCWRTIEEIAAWGGMPDAGKRGVLRAIEQRRAVPVTNRAATQTDTE